jgi:hypothetical protein
MPHDPASLAAVLDGWQGYETSLEHAIEPLTPEQLHWRPSPELRSVGELARHISLGRLIWFLRMDAPGSAELAVRVADWKVDGDGNRYFEDESVFGPDDAAELVAWLQDSWRMTEDGRGPRRASCSRQALSDADVRITLSTTRDGSQAVTL